MELCQFVEREFRFLVRQCVADDHVLAAKLSPKRIRRPLLRRGAARTFDPDEILLRHDKRLAQEAP
jgi:hypothetical protein